MSPRYLTGLCLLLAAVADWANAEPLLIISIDDLITVKEFVKATDPAMKFFAQADKQTNQKTMPFTPVGWGGTLLQALSDCMRAVRRFPYEGE